MIVEITIIILNSLFHRLPAIILFTKTIISNYRTMSSPPLSNEEMDLTPFDPSQMPSISGISSILTGQRNINPQISQDASQALRELSAINDLNKDWSTIVEEDNLTIKEEEKDSSDQKGKQDPNVSSCNILVCSSTTQAQALMSILLNANDPSHKEVIEAVMNLSNINSENKELLSKEFILFTRMCVYDWMLHKATLIEACSISYMTLLYCLKGINQTYQLQHAKTVNTSLSKLGSVADRLASNSNNLKKQTQMDRSFMEEFTRQVNITTKSLADLIESAESNTLRMTKPKTSRGSVHQFAPTVDSSSLAQDNIPGKLQAFPNSEYRSAHATISFNQDLSVLLSPKSHKGKALLELVSCGFTSKTLVNILNQDLTLVINKLQASPNFSSTYKKFVKKEDKIKLLESTIGSVPVVDNQWIRVV